MRFYDHPQWGKVPAVTSLLQEIAQESLHRWKLNNLLKLVREGEITITENTTPASLMKRADKLSQTAAEMGTWLHLIAENVFRGEYTIEPDNPHYQFLHLPTYLQVPKHLEEEVETLERLFKNLCIYMKAITGYKSIATEQRIFGRLAGPEGQDAYFAGTADQVIELYTKIILLDFKTSWATYDNHMAQVAAYGCGWNQGGLFGGLEGSLDIPRIQRLQVVRIGKSPGARPYHVQSVSPQAAKNSLYLFQCALNQWYLRSGKWGPILEDDE